jgi:hypothetical protein
MTNELFNERLDLFLQKLKNTLMRKGPEYAPKQGDRFANFNNGIPFFERIFDNAITVPAGIVANEITNYQVAWAYKIKHTVSITDIINGNLDYTEELLDEKFGDEINYLILIKEMLWEAKR